MKITEIALTACSNPLEEAERPIIKKMTTILNTNGIKVVYSELLFSRSDSPLVLAEKKAAEFMQYQRDPSIEAVFDISGGDAANLILSHLDWNELCHTVKPYFGYSDNSTVINAIITKTGRPAYHFFLKHIVHAARPEEFLKQAQPDQRNTIAIPCRFLRGTSMAGPIVGGNIRCFSKLSGTEFFPDLTGKILFLESLGGDINRVVSYYTQLVLQPGFDHISGLLFGTFTQLKKDLSETDYKAFFTMLAGTVHCPAARTDAVGHGRDAHLLPMGIPVTLTSGYHE